MASESAIVKSFAVLAAGGVRRPKEHANPAMLRASVKIYAGLLADISEAELGGAVKSYLLAGEPWWPTPGQLRELVPGLEEADAQWRLVQRVSAGKWWKQNLRDRKTGATLSVGTVQAIRDLGGLEAARKNDGIALRRAIRSIVAAPLQLEDRSS